MLYRSSPDDSLLMLPQINTGFPVQKLKHLVTPGKTRAWKNSMCWKTFETRYSWIQLRKQSVLFDPFCCAHVSFYETIKEQLHANETFLFFASQGKTGHFHLIMTGNSSYTHLDNATLSLFTDVNTSITISVIYMVVTVINLVGNTLSMWILLFCTSPKTISVIFMIHLTLTDLALGIALPFQITYQLQYYHWTLGPRMCRYFYF